MFLQTIQNKVKFVTNIFIMNLKSFLPIGTLIFFASMNISAQQSVGIGTVTPNVGAALDIVSTNKGILIPRVETSAVSSPVTGLLVYQPSNNTFYYYSSGSWKSLGGVVDADGDTKVVATDMPSRDEIVFTIDGINQLTLKRNTNGNLTVQPANVGLNTFYGYQAGDGNTTGTGNTSVGANAMQLLSSGSNNTGMGSSALNLTNTGGDNTAIGSKASLFNTIGNRNTSLGSSAMEKNTSGNSNVAIGSQSLYSNTVKSNNVSVGDSSLYTNGVGAVQPDDASFNTAVGSKAFKNNTTARFGTAIGGKALMKNTIGLFNTAVGYEALLENTIRSANAAFGQGTLSKSSTSDGNAAFGVQSMTFNTSGGSNTAVGWRSGFNSLTGSGNIFIGAQAGYNEMGSNKLYIENSTADSLNALIFGNFSSNYIRHNGRTEGIYNVTNDDTPAIYGENDNTDYYGVGVQGKGGWKGVEGIVSGVGSGAYYGVIGGASTTNSGANYGVYGSATGAATNFGVYGAASGSNNYAGYFNGAVAIGNATPKKATGYMLSVNGKIASEEVLVDLDGDWPDYVFKQDYNLRTLAEVKSHILNKGHLPDVPSAKEVEENGILLGNMNKVLLEKIEELTLYILQQEERIKKLEEKK